MGRKLRDREVLEDHLKLTLELYDCLVKLGTTPEKHLMVDIMCLQQSYERREIMEIKWIDGNSKPSDAMKKAKPCHALQELINTNIVSMKASGWVERGVDID